MMDKQEKYKDILSLKSHSAIAEEIAERQLRVIVTAYEFLAKPENNIIYIADEVGLGKTYIGLGIATLLRHFSKSPAKHRDVMIVPKKNLQDKWQKELKNFADRNYLVPGAYYPAAVASGDMICDRLRPVPADRLFSIYRMTSFSSLVSSRQELHKYFLDVIFDGDEFCAQVLTKAFKLPATRNDRDLLLRLVACLMNAVSKKIDCLIIDEAHNYKYGSGGKDGQGAKRNVVTSRFLGAVRDDDIMKLFPELRYKMKYPLAKKVICLSATPKDREIEEISRQLSCFTRNHLLVNAGSAEEIKALIPYFLIRGNMEYQLGGRKYSRNQCRLEHRRGNVDRVEDGQPILLGDDLDNLFWQLLQYKSIKHLAQKPGASFEIGMLAGFESYQLDMDKRLAQEPDDEGNLPGDREYEIYRSRKQKESEDVNVVRAVVNSYRNTFLNELPPHPKLSRLESELTAQIKRQEKSLIFVRRIATVDELQRHLLRRYDQDIVLKHYLNFTGKYAGYQTEMVRQIQVACFKVYGPPKNLEALEAVAEICLLQRWWRSHRDLPPETTLAELIAYCLSTDNETLNALIDQFVNTGKFSARKTKEFLSVLKTCYRPWRQPNEAGEEAQADEEPEIRPDSFFKRYFKKKQAGAGFKQKIYRENWFDFNYYALLAADPERRAAAFEARKNAGHYLIAREDRKPHQVFNDHQQAFRDAFIVPVKYSKRLAFGKSGNPLLKETFLTQLLLNCCAAEWTEWKKMNSGANESALLQNIAVLNSLLKAVFQNGSGLLPAFVADARGRNFTRDFIGLMAEADAPFHYLLQEIRTIIRDFELIVSVNFQDRDPAKITEALKNMSPVVGASGQDKNRSAIAARFRMPGFPYILIATDIFHEGEDLHTYCQQVYHYGVAWNPSGMEQRTGRVDRINSLSYRKLIRDQELIFDDKVQIYYPYLTRSVEVNQVVKLLTNIDRFLNDFNKIDAVHDYDGEVKIDGEITAADIPVADQRLLSSKYDVQHFKG